VNLSAEAVQSTHCET